MDRLPHCVTGSNTWPPLSIFNNFFNFWTGLCSPDHTKKDVHDLLYHPCPDKSECPSQSTCCKLAGKGYGCCPMVEAMCCSDGIHCCPKHYKCEKGIS